MQSETPATGQGTPPSPVVFTDAAASKVGELISTHVIPQPHLSLEDVLPIGKTARAKAK